MNKTVSSSTSPVRNKHVVAALFYQQCWNKISDCYRVLQRLERIHAKMSLINERYSILCSLSEGQFVSETVLCLEDWKESKLPLGFMWLDGNTVVWSFIDPSAQGSKYCMHTCTNARKIRDVHVTFVTYMHCVHVEIFTQWLHGLHFVISIITLASE